MCVFLRRTDTTARDDEIVIVGHASCGFYDLFLVVSYDLDAFEIDAQLEAKLGHVG